MAERTFREEPTGGNRSGAADLHHGFRGGGWRAERNRLRANNSFERFGNRVLRGNSIRHSCHGIVLRTTNRERLCWRGGACPLLSAHAGRNLSARAAVNWRKAVRTPVTKTIRLTKFAEPQLVVGASLLLAALTFYYFAVLRTDYSKTILLDLAPHPDSTEYFAQAQALRRDGWPSIQIGYEKLPSRYPFGYPALMLPWLKILPEADAVLAPFRTSQTMGLLLLLAVFAFYAYLATPLTGGFAVLLLATLPGFLTFCRSSLSEVSASLLIVLGFMFAYLGFKEQNRSKIYLAAIFLGL